MANLMLAFLNRGAGTADLVREALTASGAFEIREVAGAELGDAIRAAAAAGHRRVVVAGGDGTIAAAAGALVGTGTELAIVPAGTLNHFALDHGIPDDPAAAVALARDGVARPTAVGRVNGRVILNTSSAGAYVSLVMYRERLEPRFGYALATGVAALRVLLTLRRFVVEVETDDGPRLHRTPLLFVGVGERDLRMPVLGGRVPEGRAALHLMVVRGRTRGALVALAFAAAVRSLRRLRTPHLETELVTRATVRLRTHTRVSLDGEIVSLGQTLAYEFVPGGLQVVRPAEAEDGAAS